MCVWGKSICALLPPLLFRDEEEEEEGRVPRERLLGDDSRRFSFFVRSFVLSLSKKKERFIVEEIQEERSRIFRRERVNQQRDLIREERLILPKARAISVSFSLFFQLL